VIGQTIDDAAGECFDKSARLMGLPYPGGPEISRLAVKGDASRFKLPRPLLNQDNLNFSFSGLKTAVMYTVKKIGELNDQTRADLASSIEEAICEVLIRKSIAACRQEQVEHLVIAGGVAANAFLRSRLQEESISTGIDIYTPPSKYCTDNASMIAYAGHLRIAGNRFNTGDWDARPRWELDSIG